MIPQRRKRNSSKVNLVISFVFQTVLVVAIFFFAAREGMLGNKLKKITVAMVPKEKPPEKPKEKEPEPKPETAKEEKPVQTAKVAATPPPAPTTTAAAPPPVAAAPPSAQLPGFDFDTGVHSVQSFATDPMQMYKGLVEFTIKGRWVRPENVADKDFVAEVEITIDKAGRITGNQWKKGSGNKQWDDSVRKALAQTPAMNRPPPKGFPPKFLVRFDVQTDAEPLLSANLQ